MTTDTDMTGNSDWHAFTQAWLYPRRRGCR